MSNEQALIEMINVSDVSVDEATVDAIDNAVNEKYFTKVWHPKQKKYKYSGLAIIDETARNASQCIRCRMWLQRI